MKRKQTARGGLRDLGVFHAIGMVAGLAFPKPALCQDVVTLPLKANAYVDMGQVVKGERESNVDNAKTMPVDNYFVSNIAISLLSQTVVKEKLRLSIGVGGLFWYPFSYSSASSDTRSIHFGPGVSEASFQYDFQESLFLKFGFFGYKYNGDARNLGEYLLRSQAYPGLVKTGGWSILNSAQYQSLGAQMRWNTLGGAWSHDFLLFSEFEETPIFSMSPSYVSTLRLGKVLEFGAGITLHHWLPVKPSEETPSGTRGLSENIYVEIPDMPSLPAIDTVIFGQPYRQPGVDSGATLKGMEKTLTQYQSGVNGQRITFDQDAAGNPIYLLGSDTLRPSVRQKLTYQGIKIMGRASFDIKPLFGWEENLGPEDLKFFGEMAVLGVEDQPYYYTQIWHRIPVMMGFNFPTFGLLDHLTFETEYYPNPWQANRRNAFEFSWPIWFLSAPETAPADFEAQAAMNYKKDDWKWSVHASKTLIRGLEIYAQAASDHLRLRDEFVRTSYLPLTNASDQWYYLIRLQWGL